QELRDLDDVLEATSNRRERTFHVFIGLCRLRLEIAGRADEVAVAVEAQLTGDIDDATRHRRLHNMRVAGLLGASIRLQEAQMGRRLAGAQHGLRPRARSARGGEERSANENISARYCLTDVGQPRQTRWVHDSPP